MVLFLGASSLGNVFRSTNETEGIEVVREALRQGINYIDVAPWYGHGLAEKVLGKVYLKSIHTKLLIICICTKKCPMFSKYQNVQRSSLWEFFYRHFFSRCFTSTLVLSSQDYFSLVTI